MSEAGDARNISRKDATVSCRRLRRKFTKVKNCSEIFDEEQKSELLRRIFDRRNLSEENFYGTCVLLRMSKSKHILDCFSHLFNLSFNANALLNHLFFFIKLILKLFDTPFVSFGPLKIAGTPKENQKGYRPKKKKSTGSNLHYTIQFLKCSRL